MPEGAAKEVNKPLIVISLQVDRGGNNLLRRGHCSGNPLPFLKCANGTLLPLTLGRPSVTMRLGKSFTTSAEGGTD
jgi:hypothetical protein